MIKTKTQQNKSRISISISKKFYQYCLLACFSLSIYITHSFIDQQLNKNDQIIFQGSSELILAHKEFEDAIKYVSVVAQNIGEEIKKNPQNKIYIFNTLRKFRVLYGSKDLTNILSISMFSWSGKDQQITVNSEFGILNKPIDLSKRDYLPLTITNPETIQIGAPVLGAVSKQYIIPIGIGIFDDYGIYQGSLVAGINIHEIYKRITKDKKSDLSVNIVFDKKFDVISNETIKDNPYLSHADLSKPAIQVLKKFSILNSENAILYKNISNYKYGILVTLNNKYGNQNYLRKNYLFEFASILLMFSFLIFFFKKVFIRPIIRMSNIAKSISSGNTDIKIPHSRIKEIDDLSNSINAIKNFVIIENLLKTELSQAIESKKNLISVTSHDLRNYISGISGLIDLIISKKYETESGIDEELLEIASKQTKELMYFVEDLLDTNHGKNKELKLDKIEEIDLKDTINRLLLLNKSLLTKNKLETKVEIQENLPSFFGNSRYIKQILNNLITNSIKYSTQYTEILLSVKFLPESNNFYLDIQDHGIGMDDDEIKLALNGDGELITKPDHKKEVDSHGVGMRIIQTLVKLHQGKIKIKSKKGVGSTFTIILPLLRENPDKTETELQQNKIDNKIFSKLKGMTAILAEDNHVNIIILSTKLKKDYQIDVKMAQDGEELIEIYTKTIESKSDLDFIISDINMPRLNGIDAIKKIREYEKQNRLKRTPVILCCGDSDQKSINSAREAGVDAIFIKGDDLSKLISEIYALV